MTLSHGISGNSTILAKASQRHLYKNLLQPLLLLKAILTLFFSTLYHQTSKPLWSYENIFEGAANFRLTMSLLWYDTPKCQITTPIKWLQKRQRKFADDIIINWYQTFQVISASLLCWKGQFKGFASLSECQLPSSPNLNECVYLLVNTSFKTIYK